MSSVQYPVSHAHFQLDVRPGRRHNTAASAGVLSQTRPSSVRACPMSPQLLHNPPEGPNTVWDLGSRRQWMTQCEERAASYRKSQAKHSIEISTERRPARHSHSCASRWVGHPATCNCMQLTSYGLKTTGSAYEKTKI